MFRLVFYKDYRESLEWLPFNLIQFMSKQIGVSKFAYHYLRDYLHEIKSVCWRKHIKANTFYLDPFQYLSDYGGVLLWWTYNIIIVDDYYDHYRSKICFRLVKKIFFRPPDAREKLHPQSGNQIYFKDGLNGST